jgi:hypothetical protein
LKKEKGGIFSEKVWKNKLFNWVKDNAPDSITANMKEVTVRPNSGTISEGISVSDERHFGKKGIIIMIDDNGKKVSAIFKDKKNADKFNRNKSSDIQKLLQLAKKTKYPKAIDESVVNEATRQDLGMTSSVSKRRAKAELKKTRNDGSKVYGLDKDGKRVELTSINDVDKFKKFELDADINEATLSQIHKAAKKGSYPVSIVATMLGKVVKQELVKTPMAVPAAFMGMQGAYPKAKISVESRTGQILFQEMSISMGESINEYLSPSDVDSAMKEFGIKKIPISSQGERILKGMKKEGFIKKVTNKERLIYFYESLGKEKFGYSTKGKPLSPLVGRYWNDITSDAIFFGGKMAAWNVVTNIKDRLANREEVDSTYYMLKNYFDSFGMNTNRSRVFKSATFQVDEWLKRNKKIAQQIGENTMVNEISAINGLKQVVKGNTKEVEGIKVSKEMAQAMIDWFNSSPYGRKYPRAKNARLHISIGVMLSFGLDRYAKHKGAKEELKYLKSMKESVDEGYGKFIKAKNLNDIIKLSKQKKNATFYVTDDNNSRIGAFYLKNGKFAKATSANPNYDLQRNKTKLRDRSDVIYKYKVDESVVNEGKKRFKRQDGIGKAKYTVSYHDGKKKHRDGSDFFDIKIFKNKKDLSDFVGTLAKQGYKHESVNESVASLIDQIRQDSKDVKDFVKNIFKDSEFKKMSNDKDFIKYLKSIYEGINENDNVITLEERVNLFFEENIPTNPSKWSYYKSQAKKKFDVYPSAYANGWAAKQYKAAGGGWRKKK